MKCNLGIALGLEEHSR
uniref:Uncharacterized protein n=1 Tax=Arundo donax TaxID=35708 RepID=A0A0A8Y9R2_ARUDO